MPKAAALLVGLTSVNPAAYNGWDGRNGCYGCELDVDNLERIVSPIGYSVQILKTKEATARNILGSIEAAARSLTSGDMFVFYYSGHGGQSPDLDADETDGQDETLVAYDRQLLDDELGRLWLLFSPGVHIFMISDSCNSGTNYKNIRTVKEGTPINFASLLNTKPGAKASSMQAQMIHIGGCRDGFTSAGYAAGGAMTMALCNSWAGGAFQGSYRDFYNQIVALVKKSGESQAPQFSKYGPVSAEFEASKPFSIAGFTKGAADAKSATAFLEELPIEVVYNPSEIVNYTLNSRVDPFTAAVVGTLVGGGLSLLGKKAGPVRISSQSTENEDLVRSVRCRASFADLRDRLPDFWEYVAGSEALLKGIENGINRVQGKRIFGIDDAVAAAYLVGVVIGSQATK